MCEVTGCLMFRAKHEIGGLPLIEQEAFLNIAIRQRPAEVNAKGQKCDRTSSSVVKAGNQAVVEANQRFRPTSLFFDVQKAMRSASPDQKRALYDDNGGQ
jgi:hypothetical protein